MSDIRLVYNQEVGTADIVFNGSSLEIDDGLETSAIVSIFTDRRAYADDPLPEESGDRRGWWGDAVPRTESDRIGSRMWLLHREKQTEHVRYRAEEYAREACGWIIEDGIADASSATAEWLAMGMLGISITVQRPAQPDVESRYALLWNAQALRS